MQAHGVEPFDLAGGQVPEDLRLLVHAVGWDQYGEGATDHLLGRVAEESTRSAVPARDDPLERLADDRVVRRVHHGGQAQPRLLGLPALGRVADGGADERPVCRLDQADGELDRELGAVLAASMGLETRAPPLRTRLREVPLESSGKRVPEALDHQHLGRPPHELFAGVTVELLGLRVDAVDRAVPGDDDDRVGRGLHETPERGLRGPGLAELLDRGGGFQASSEVEHERDAVVARTLEHGRPDEDGDARPVLPPVLFLAEAGDTGPVQLLDRALVDVAPLARREVRPPDVARQELLARMTQEVCQRRVHLEDPPVQVADEDPDDPRPRQPGEPRLGGLLCLFGDDPPRHVVDEHEASLATVEDDGLHLHLDPPERTVLAAMPHEHVLDRQRARDDREVLLAVLRRPEVRGPHRQKLLARVAVSSRGGFVHFHELERGGVDDAHRLRTGAEDGAIAVAHLLGRADARRDLIEASPVRGIPCDRRFADAASGRGRRFRNRVVNDDPGPVRHENPPTAFDGVETIPSGYPGRHSVKQFLEVRGLFSGQKAD